MEGRRRKEMGMDGKRNHSIKSTDRPHLLARINKFSTSHQYYKEIIIHNDKHNNTPLIIFGWIYGWMDEWMDE
jgi:hypothetical protein